MIAAKTTAVAATLSPIDSKAVPLRRGARRKNRQASRTLCNVDIRFLFYSRRDRVIFGASGGTAGFPVIYRGSGMDSCRR